jgi:hypothetical protein
MGFEASGNVSMPAGVNCTVKPVEHLREGLIQVVSLTFFR